MYYYNDMFIDLIYKIAVKCEMHTYTMCPKQYVNCHCSVLNKDKVSVYIYIYIYIYIEKIDNILQPSLK